ncbi:MAG: RNA 2',3'-cyclic phosphodiesterase [Tissierellia bacterium]|nr:RNA 2',3'-cyclic phosphodiesterase [Tissierellia bacterium]
MRLFIAINFNHDVKDKIDRIKTLVEKNARQGRFVHRDNLHLTLEFLGEIPEERIGDIQDAMDKLSHNPFNLKLKNLGFFKRMDGHIYWLGIQDSEELMTLQSNLHKLLLEKGFKLENRKYRPHITLGRRVKLRSFNQEEVNRLLDKIQIEVKSVDLMESKHIEGKLVYEVIYSKKL